MHNANQRAGITAYIQRLQPLMGLGEWQIDLRNECPDGHDCDDIAGCIAVSRYRRQASLYLPDDFWDEEPAERRQTIVHELLHCHFDASCQVFTDVATKMSTAEYIIVKELWDTVHEPAIDLLACAIAERLPLMEEGK